MESDFNPRSREGSDQILESLTSCLCNFNPRSREGSDEKNFRVYGISGKFQSTLPRGERPSARSSSSFSV